MIRLVIFCMAILSISCTQALERARLDEELREYQLTPLHIKVGGNLTTEPVSHIYTDEEQCVFGPPCSVDIHAYAPSLPQRVLLKLKTPAIMPDVLRGLITDGTECFLHIGRPSSHEPQLLRPHYWVFRDGGEGKASLDIHIKRLVDGVDLFGPKQECIEVHSGDRGLVCSPNNMHLGWLPNLASTPNYQDLFASIVTHGERRAITVHYIPTYNVWGEILHAINYNEAPSNYGDLRRFLAFHLGQAPEMHILNGLLTGRI